MAHIQTLIESERRNGYRRAGAYYLKGEHLIVGCGMFPIPLHAIESVESEITFDPYSFTWLDEKKFGNVTCQKPFCEIVSCHHYRNLHVAAPVSSAVLWVGERSYPCCSDFRKESMAQGIRKRIFRIPKGLQVGSTIIFLAHNRAITKFEDDGPHLEIKHQPGIFSAFIVSGVEYIMRGDESGYELNQIEKRGISIVRLIRDTEAQISLV